MDYRSSVDLYEESLSKLGTDAFHHRLYARALSHLGLWDSAAAVLTTVTLDSGIRAASHSDLDRIRLFDKPTERAPLRDGGWAPLRVKFGGDAKFGAVLSLGNDILATASMQEGTVTFWSTSGDRVTRVTDLGKPVSVRGDPADPDRVWVADIEGDRVIRIDRRRGIESAVALDGTGVHGIRDVAPDANGDLWIADFGGGRVLRVASSGEKVAEFGKGMLARPTSILLFGRDILVAESGAGRVLRYDRNGRLLREYSHPRMNEPIFLSAAPFGFAIQNRDGLVFWGGDDREVVGPALVGDSDLVTSSLGLALDPRGGMWWSNGVALMAARHVPEDMPRHAIEVIRTSVTRDPGGFARLDLTATVLDRDGRPLPTMSKRAFRLLRGNDEVLLPIGVANLSEVLTGRKLIIAVESSDVVENHREALNKAILRLVTSLTSRDSVAVLEIADTWTIARGFTRSPELLRNTLMSARTSVAPIDVVSFDAIENAIRKLAPSDQARGIVWITSGENFLEREFTRIERMGIMNQVSIFPLHIGEANAERMTELAERTGGSYYRLYSQSPLDSFVDALSRLRSGRYRIAAEFPLPESHLRGKWFDFTLESHFEAEVAFDICHGYYWY